MMQHLDSQQALRGLYLITDDISLDKTRLDQIHKMVLQGLPVLQYRSKTSSAKDRFTEANKLNKICRSGETLLIINDDLELAQTVGAHGVHLGEHDANLGTARSRLGKEFIIGKSCYADYNNAQAAVAAAADYIAFGSFFSSRTKPDAAKASVELLNRASIELPIPVVAIGGITLSNAPSVIESGADMLAVIRDIWDQADPCERVREYARLFT